MTGPFELVHRVRFDEVDAAGIAYFPRFFTWCHDAMEAMLAPVEGGYVGLVRDRRLGLPAVHAEADYASPVRFGDEVRIAASVERVGRSSIGLRFELSRVDDGRRVATLRHVVALTDLTVLRSRPVPGDILAVLARYQASPQG